MVDFPIFLKRILLMELRYFDMVNVALCVRIVDVNNEEIKCPGLP
jgi:hypothetical protein